MDIENVKLMHMLSRTLVKKWKKIKGTEEDMQERVNMERSRSKLTLRVTTP